MERKTRGHGSTRCNAGRWVRREALGWDEGPPPFCKGHATGESVPYGEDPSDEGTYIEEGDGLCPDDDSRGCGFAFDDVCPLDDGTSMDVCGLTARQLGALGETIAANYLEHRGYDILERGYRCPEGEADIIALDGETGAVVLVEVKTRRSRRPDDMSPEEAVDRRKRMRYRRIASCYLMEHFPIMSMRFDAIGVQVVGGHDAYINHFYDVFTWEAR